ncbi:HTH domain-containing protein [Neisseria gonorrhoeae]|nr:HTH domain-containing protein [Neisseria gonorrhoeae]
MAYPKLKTTKRDVTAKELAKRFGCSTRTVFRAWSQSRADYLAETLSAAINRGNTSAFPAPLGTGAASLCRLKLTTKAKQHDKIRNKPRCSVLGIQRFFVFGN